MAELNTFYNGNDHLGQMLSFNAETLNILLLGIILKTSLGL